LNKSLFRTVPLVLLAAGLVLSSAACGSGGNHSAGPSSPSATTATTAHGIPKSAFTNLESFTGPAVSKYGLPTVQAAYEEMVNFIFETGWNSTLIRTSSAQLSATNFANAHSYMTPKFRKSFDATFASVVQADKASVKKLEHAMFFGVGGPNGAQPVKSGSLVTDRGFSRATLALDHAQGYERLSLTFSAKASIQVQDAAGKRYALPSIRLVRYWLVKNTGSSAQLRPWLIDAWEIRLTESAAKAAK
jgi:hypothetical protein